MTLCGQIKNMMKGFYASYMINEYELDYKDGKYFKTYQFGKNPEDKTDLVFFRKKDIVSENYLE